jgi:hypothetical protein
MTDNAHGVTINSTPGVKTQLGSITNDGPSIAPQVAEQAKSLPEASQAALKASLTRSFGADAVTRAFGTAQAPTDGSGPIKIEPGNVNATKLFPQGGVNDQQAQGAIETLIANWTGDRNQLMNELGRMGVTKPALGNAPHTAPTVNPLEPPRSAAEYKLDFVGLNFGEGSDMKALAQFDNDLRAGMLAAALNTTTGPTAIREALELSLSLKGATPAQRQQSQDDQLAIVRNLVGNDKYEETIDKAARAFNRIEEGLRTRLRNGGVARSARLLLELAQAEDRYQAKAKAKQS